MFQLCILFSILLFPSALNDSGYQPSLSPIVLLPGDGGKSCQIRIKVLTSISQGNQLEARQLPSGAWYRLWLDVWQLRGSKVRAWADTIKLVYDRNSRVSRNVAGVETRVPGWGETDSVEYLGQSEVGGPQCLIFPTLDPSWSAWLIGDVGNYMHDLVNYLVSLGYRRGHTVR